MATDPGAGRTARAGLAYGLVAYAAWGFGPVYFKAVRAVPASEVLAHRVVWSALFLALLLIWRRQLQPALVAIRTPRVLATLACTAVLIASNWLTFIWAITNDQILQASLGYYINPLLNVALGALLLGERQSRQQMVAVAVAAIGVGYLTFSVGELPAVALFLAVTFASYGLLRKTAAVDALAGLAVETTILVPVAIAFLAWLGADGTLAFAHRTRPLDLLLVAAGPVTALPLLWFTNAVRRLRFSTVGILQYIAPTLQLLLAVFVFGEPFSAAHRVTFALIWLAVILYLHDAARSRARPDGPTMVAVKGATTVLE